MPEVEPPEEQEPAAATAAEHEDHDDHPHEHTADGNVLKTRRGCGDKCAKCLACVRRTTIQPE